MRVGPRLGWQPRGEDLRLDCRAERRVFDGARLAPQLQHGVVGEPELRGHLAGAGGRCDGEQDEKDHGRFIAMSGSGINVICYKFQGCWARMTGRPAHPGGTTSSTAAEGTQPVKPLASFTRRN